jgi:hypothetical protein
MSAKDMPEQGQRTFGQPPINLYLGDRFFVECQVWLRGSTVVHEHAFSGAFGLIESRSIHTIYRFIRTKQYSSCFIVGDATVHNAELLCPGQVHEIAKGVATTHGLYHLDATTVTIVVRTFSDPETPQYSMVFPNLLVLQKSSGPTVTLERFMLSLAKTRPNIFRARLAAMLTENDPSIGFSLIYTALKYCPDAVHSMAGSAQAFQQFLDLLVSIAKRQIEVDRFEHFAQGIMDDDLRIFSAFLVNVLSSLYVLKLLREEFGWMPVIERVSELVETLASRLYKVDFRGRLKAITQTELSKAAPKQIAGSGGEVACLEVKKRAPFHYRLTDLN